MPDRSPFALAALACAAVRGLEPVRVQGYGPPDHDVDSAVVEDDLGRRWLVRAPRNQAAAARLDCERRLLTELSGWLPFAVPDVAGTATLPGGGHAMVYRMIPGATLDLNRLKPGPGLTAALGRALAAIHELPERLVEEAGLPVYSAEDYRQRRLAEVDRAASTGHVPPGLLQRWETQLEEAGAWRFVPCVVHGDLASENVLVDGDEVAAVLEWGEARVADPADDLAWLVSGAAEPAVESVLEAYAVARRQPPDRDLRRRARLAGELALARWLLHGVSSDDSSIVDDAVMMLSDLDATVTGAAS
ncbi:MAG TPA: phosphotransferase [Kineosporiaceae bacterium]|nr:phosphotransferase [Kineosporiaceae bacterium]